MEISRTDMGIIMKYLGDAARLYGAQPGIRAADRERTIRRLLHRLERKIHDIK